MVVLFASLITDASNSTTSAELPAAPESLRFPRPRRPPVHSHRLPEAPMPWLLSSSDKGVGRRIRFFSASKLVPGQIRTPKTSPPRSPDLCSQPPLTSASSSSIRSACPSPVLPLSERRTTGSTPALTAPRPQAFARWAQRPSRAPCRPPSSTKWAEAHGEPPTPLQLLGQAADLAQCSFFPCPRFCLLFLCFAVIQKSPPSSCIT